MYINHDITIDLVNPTTPTRLQMKQGDVLSRNVRIYLLENGEPWKIPGTAQAVIRYHSYDPETQTRFTGKFDELENGDLSYVIYDNCFEVMPNAAMLAHPGLVTVDILLQYGGRALATFDFEIYVNRAAVDGTEPEIRDYYRISTLDAINKEFDTLRSAIETLGGGAYL